MKKKNSVKQLTFRLEMVEDLDEITTLICNKIAQNA